MSHNALNSHCGRNVGEFNPYLSCVFLLRIRKILIKYIELDAIDAYNQKLVKKIKVKGIEVATSLGTGGYLYLERINVFKDKNPSATIEMEINQANGLSRKSEL